MPQTAMLFHPRQCSGPEMLPLSCPYCNPNYRIKDSLKRALDVWASEMSGVRVLERWRAREISGNVVAERAMKVSIQAIEEKKDVDFLALMSGAGVLSKA